MQKRDKKRHVVRSPDPMRYDPLITSWARQEHDWTYQDCQTRPNRSQARTAPNPLSEYSDAVKVALLGGTCLFFLLLMWLGETLMHSGVTWLMIVGFLIWVPATGLLLSLVAARVWHDLLKPLWKRLQRVKR